LNCDTHQYLPDVKNYTVANASPAASEMADSGLGTGSISPHDNTTSENLNTDLEVTQTAEYASANDDDLDRIHAERIRNKSDHETLSYNEHCELLNNSNYREKSTVQSVSNDHSVIFSSSETEHQLTDTAVQEAKLKLIRIIN